MCLLFYGKNKTVNPPRPPLGHRRGRSKPGWARGLGSEKAQDVLVQLAPLGKMVIADDDMWAWSLLGTKGCSTSWDPGTGTDKP